MSEETTKPSNFIRNIIKADNESGKHGGRVHTRFPPEPNGYLHIGHAKSICLNFGLANDYDGLCNLRFDDTNPQKENEEFVNAIKEDVRWLGFDWQERLFFSSNYFEQLYTYAVQLIEQGNAYVCDLNAEQTREYRNKTITRNHKAAECDPIPPALYVDVQKAINSGIRNGHSRFDSYTSWFLLDPAKESKVDGLSVA